MRSLRPVLLLIALALPWPAFAAPVDDVQQTFQAYKTAILESDGNAAASLVTQDSRDYFRKLADEALNLDRDALHQIQLGDRLYVMLLRYTLERSQLESMTGGEVVAYAVDKGWVGKEGASRLQLGNYEVNGETASGAILRPDGEASTFKMEFAKENGRWVLKLAELMKLTGTAIDYSARQSGLSEDEFLLQILEYSTGRKPGPEIWSPPQ